jgi:transcriptional regulator with XRE-family HTH domain
MSTPHFAAALKAAREQKNMTQEDLAKLAELSPDILSRLERGVGAPVLDQFARLARALAVTSDRLLGLDASPAAEEPEDDAADLRRLLRSSRRLSPRELNLVAQLADALLSKGSST